MAWPGRGNAAIDAERADGSPADRPAANCARAGDRMTESPDDAVVDPYAGPHDEGEPEQYAGDPVPDPWSTDPAEEDSGGAVDPGAVPGGAAR